MTVEDTERTLPAAGPGVLGEFRSKPTGHLISTLTSPLTAECINTYVVFVPGTLNITEYVWTIRSADFPQELTLRNSSGVMQWRPSSAGKYTITVELHGSQTVGQPARPLETIDMEQRVEAVSNDLKVLGALKNDKVTPAGDFDAGLRTLHELKGYAVAAASTTNGVISARLLCALAYTSMLMGVPRQVAEVLSPGLANLVLIDAVQQKPVEEALNECQPLGVCRIAPHIAALYLGKLNPVAEPLTDGWLQDAYRNLDRATKYEIYNLLRFPKSNMQLAASLLVAQQNEWRTAVTASAGKLVGEYDLTGKAEIAAAAIRSLATILGAGGLAFANKVARTRSAGSPQSLEISDFGRAVELNTRLPIFTVLIEPDGPTQAAIGLWNEEIGVETSAAQRKEARIHFKGGLLHYVYLSQYYAGNKAEPIFDMLEWIPKNIIRFSHSLLPSAVDLHKDVEGPLRQALENAKAVLPKDFKFKQVGGFVPRKISPQQEGLSNHAYGRAIDFDASANPMWFAAEMNAINTLLGRVVWRPGKSGAKTDAERGEVSRYDDMAAAAAEFQRTLIPTKATKASSVVGGLAEPLLKVQKAGGFLTIPKQVVDAMVISGFGWGGHYRSFRDFMHFEMPPVRGHKPPEGL